jgi:cobyrinic acid a,c-diamide synthase
MYLSQGIALKNGANYTMAGALPGVCQMQTKIQALGYAEVVLKAPSLFGEAGSSLKGHSFHYSSLDDSRFADEGWRTVYDVRTSGGGTIMSEGYCKGNILVSYVHLHLASHPNAVRCFKEFCLK